MIELAGNETNHMKLQPGNDTEPLWAYIEGLIRADCCEGKDGNRRNTR